MIGVAPMLALALAAPAPSELPDLFHDACLWEVGSNAEKVKQARAQLVTGGDETLRFLIPGKLDTGDTLVTRALNVVLTGIGKGAVPLLVQGLDSDKPSVRRNAADLLGALGAVEAAPAIARLLADPDTRLGALAALGALKAEPAVPEVVALVESEAPERPRVTAVATLGAIGGVQAECALLRQLCQGSAPLRFAAQYALEKLRATASLRAALADPEPTVRLHGIAGLGHIGGGAGRRDLLVLLDADDAIVRGFAIEALADAGIPWLRARFEERLAAEGDPFVRTKLKEALDRIPR